MNAPETKLRETPVAAVNAVSPADFTGAMRLFPAGCSVITSCHQGERAGLTATAVMSICAEPPRIAVCVNRSVRAHPLIVASGTLAVNVLSDAQEEVGKCFAGMIDGVIGADRFDAGEWTSGAKGAPLLEGALVNFDCNIVESIDIGTHSLFICEVIGVGAHHGKGALAYFNRKFLSILNCH
jgi:flavin reductase (DIM6/NTAB) family NADH-FMN oxidoreductase RutF